MQMLHKSGKLSEQLALGPNINMKKLRKNVATMIMLCPLCQKLSQLRPVIEARRFTLAVDEPWQVLSLDHITGLPLSEETGYEAILVLIDNFSRFVEMYPVQSSNSEETARILLQHFGRYGLSIKIRSDRGTEFMNELIKHLFELTKLEHVKTLAYSKQENAISERANKEVLRIYE
jgi:transposase InsO family protein